MGVFRWVYLILTSQSVGLRRRTLPGAALPAPWPGDLFDYVGMSASGNSGLRRYRVSVAVYFTAKDAPNATSPDVLAA
jgi:hypothetical protein